MWNCSVKTKSKRPILATIKIREELNLICLVRASNRTRRVSRQGYLSRWTCVFGQEATGWNRDVQLCNLPLTGTRSHSTPSVLGSLSWSVSVADLGLDIIKCRLSTQLPWIPFPASSPPHPDSMAEPVTLVATLLAGCCRLFLALQLRLRLWLCARVRVRVQLEGPGSASGCSCNRRVPGGHKCHHKCADVSCLHPRVAATNSRASVTRKHELTLSCCGGFKIHFQNFLYFPLYS